MARQDKLLKCSSSIASTGQLSGYCQGKGRGNQATRKKWGALGRIVGELVICLLTDDYPIREVSQKNQLETNCLDRLVDTRSDSDSGCELAHWINSWSMRSTAYIILAGLSWAGGNLVLVSWFGAKSISSFLFEYKQFSLKNAAEYYLYTNWSSWLS